MHLFGHVPPFVEFVYFLLLRGFPCIAPFLLSVGCGRVSRSRPACGDARAWWLGLFLPFAVPAAIVLVGVVFAAPQAYDASTGSYAVYVLDAHRTAAPHAALAVALP